MWFYPFLIAAVILCIVGGTVAGGVYTLVLVPIAVIAVIGWGVLTLWGRATAGREDRPGDRSRGTGGPLPHRRARPSGHQLGTPADLADARRREQ